METEGWPMNQPRLSVLMPVYNCAEYLDEAIGSILGQTYADFRFVIVNDGSTDDSLQVLARHAERDKRIEVIDRPNGGIVNALNAGLARCKTEFIARMDGDDIALPARFQRQLDFLDAHTDVGALGSAAIFTGPDGSEGTTFAFPIEHAAIYRLMLATGGCGLLHPTVMIRKSIIDQVGWYRDAYRYAEDLDLFLRLSERTRLHNLPEPLLRYRQHGNSVGGSRRPWQTRSAVDAVMDAMKRRNLKHNRGLKWMAHCASWNAGDVQRWRDAFRYAGIAWAHGPFSLAGPRAFARAIVRWTHHQAQRLIS